MGESEADCPVLNAESGGGNEISWRAVALTHVEYPEGDLIGKLLAYISLLPIAIIVGFAAVLLLRRELHTITFFAGIIISEAINWVTKHVVREPRPCRGHSAVLFTEYGMPSSHSQFMWFFATYMVLFVYIRLHPPGNSIVELVWRNCLAVGVLLLALLVSISRVYLNYHTHRQVVCGALLGIMLAVPWFIATQVFFAPFFPWIASWRLSEYLLVRDSSLIPNVLWFEYTTARQEARTRQRKLGPKSS